MHWCYSLERHCISAAAARIERVEVLVEVFGIKKGLEVGMTHGDSPQLGMMLPLFPTVKRLAGLF